MMNMMTKDSKGLYNIVNIEQALAYSNALYVDVRSPAEFSAGRLPGAINIPVFNNAERAVVGTLYKQQGREIAMNYGLSLFSQKLPEFVAQFKKLSRNKRLVVYCWRGGMRSRAAVTLANLADVRCEQLSGGYKQYRAKVLQELNGFAVQPEIVVLCGSTGAGKTDLLKVLAADGVAVIDLEKLANHRGSAFGGVGLGKLQTAHNFDALLLPELKKYQNSRYIIVECESKRIGNVYLPDCLFKKMACGKKILLRTPAILRAQRLVREYTEIAGGSEAELTDSLKLLEQKLGKNNYSKLQMLLRQQQYQEFTMILLEKYYDPLYGYETAADRRFDAIVDGSSMKNAAQYIKKCLEEWYGE